MDGATGEGYVGRALETHPGTIFGSMPAKGVTAHVDELGVLDEEVPVTTGIDRVSAKGDTIATGQVDVVFLASDDVARNSKESRRTGCIGFLLDANVCPSGRLGGLNGIGRDGNLVHAGSIGRDVDENFRSRFRFGFMGPKVVVFNIVSRDLQVAYFRAFDTNPALPVIADMATCYIDLVEVHAIEIMPTPVLK